MTAVNDVESRCPFSNDKLSRQGCPEAGCSICGVADGNHWDPNGYVGSVHGKDCHVHPSRMQGRHEPVCVGGPSPWAHGIMVKGHKCHFHVLRSKGNWRTKAPSSWHIQTSACACQAASRLKPDNWPRTRQTGPCRSPGNDRRAQIEWATGSLTQYPSLFPALTASWPMIPPTPRTATLVLSLPRLHSSPTVSAASHLDPYASASRGLVVGTLVAWTRPLCG